MKKLFIITAMIFCALLLAGCKEAALPEDIKINYDFKESDHGWTGDFTDLPIDYDAEMYGLEFAHTDLPASLNSEGKALMLTGQNSSDDLFMYVKKQLTTADGITPDTEYFVRFTVEFATDAPAGVMGIGGPPGEAVWIKVGAAPMEPVPVAQTDSPHPNFVANVDKGSQNDDGEHAVRIGDAAKVNNDEFYVYELKTLNNSDRPLEVTSDENGSLWIFVGTDSGFEGRTTLYYTNISVELALK